MGKSDEKKWLVQLYQEAFPKVRPYIAIMMIVALAFSPLIDNIALKITVVSALGVTLMFMMFDLFRGVNQRLDKINENFKAQKPPRYDNYNIAITEMREILVDRLSHNKDVSIRVIGVSAQFTWKQLIEDTLPSLFTIGHRNPKIHVELLIVKPAVLRNWGQKRLEMDAENTLKCKPLFEKKYEKQLASGKITISVLQYDNIPHWHGVMIDDDIFFMGRCKWEIKDDRYHLQVGQKEYRQFTKTDNFDGDVRIEMFTQWFSAYKLRAQRLEKLGGPGRD